MDYGTSALEGKSSVRVHMVQTLLSPERVFTISACVQWFLPTIRVRGFRVLVFGVCMFCSCLRGGVLGVTVGLGPLGI